jgi:phosphoribosylaminoimidazole-succinocarboxamide synthase
MKFVHKGSTKDVYSTNNHYLFKFSNRYSVFDWGEMPDQIPHKGEALALFTKKIYRHFEAQGIKTHLIDEVVGNDELLIAPFEVIRGEKIMPVKENIFIPLEVIFRLGVTTGSSVLKRFKTLEDWKCAGVDRAYSEGEKFATPMIEFTTKLERFDRPLDHQEAQKISNLNEAEWKTLLETTQTIALKLKDIFSPLGIELWDGKVEFALGSFQGDAREIILVDTIGPDELRLTKNGIQLSKEIIRQFYKKSDWYPKLESVKAEFGEDFKNHIDAPAPLPSEFLGEVEHMYGLLASETLSRTPDLKKLDSLVEKLKKVTQ